MSSDVRIKTSDGIVQRRKIIRLLSNTALPEAFPKFIRPVLRLEARIAGFFVLSFFALLTVFPLLSAFEAHVVNVTAKIDPPPNVCDAKNRSYWQDHEGCLSGTGSSIWESNVQSLSGQFSSFFAGTTGTQMCEYLFTSNCPSQNTTEGKLCAARAELLSLIKTPKTGIGLVRP